MIAVAERQLHLLSGRAHPELAEEVADCLDIPLCAVQLGNFANGEISCRIGQSVRGIDAFVMQSHTQNVNNSILEQLVMIDAAKRASAASITAVCPYLGYARQDRKANGREPITAKLIIDMLSAAGADRIMSVDLHSGQIQGFFNGPFDHVVAMPTLAGYLRRRFRGQDIVIVSPDAGQVKQAERFCGLLDCELAIIHKNRSTTVHNTVEARYLIGEVTGKTCVIVDDMIDTAGTICAAADLLVANGAASVYGAATHGIFSGPAMECIEQSAFSEVVVTNTLPINGRVSRKIKTLSIASLLADAIAAVFAGSSVSALFDGKNQF